MKVLLRSIWGDLRREFGGWIEPFSSWENADAHRMYWRPEKVRVILLAESHVFTNEAEAELRCGLSAFTEEPIPDAFIKLVYCLGYGENDLLPQQVKPNAGTRQFWEILYSCLTCVGDMSDFAPIHKTKTPDLDQRINNKLNILHELRMRGIWLLDASLAALYPKKNLPKGMYQECLRKSWPYVSGMIDEASPEKIVVIGKTIWNAFLRYQVFPPGIPCYVQPQPQQRDTNFLERLEGFRAYFDLVSGKGRERRAVNTLSKKQAAARKVRSEEQGIRCVWTFNEQSDYYSRGGLSLGTPVILLTLYFKPQNCATELLICEHERLDLNQLLNERCIQYDPVGSLGPNVRIIIRRDEGARFFIQTRKGAPKFFLGEYRLEL
jgi:hypothetical protein